MLMHAKYNNNSQEQNSGSQSNHGGGGGDHHSSGRKLSNGQDPFNVHIDDGVQLISPGGLDHENNHQHMLEPLLH